MLATDASSETSVLTAMAFGSAAAAAFAPSSLRSAMTTAAPSSDSLLAMARPIPWAPPVTIATRPSSFIVGCSSCSL